MNKKLIQAQDVFLEKINQICSKFGLNNVMVQLYALLYLNKTMSLDEMAERLKISKGSVSVNIRALENYGAVRRVWIKGSRRDHYEADTDIYKVIMNRVKSLVQDRFQDIEDMIESSSKALNSANSISNNEEENGVIKLFQQRLDELKRLKHKAQTLFNLFSSGLLNNVLIPRANNNKETEEAKLITHRTF